LAFLAKNLNQHVISSPETKFYLKKKLLQSRFQMNLTPCALHQMTICILLKLYLTLSKLIYI